MTWNPSRTTPEFQSTLPVGGSDMANTAGGKNKGISIHAPRGGERPSARVNAVAMRKFQSTLPVGGSDHCHPAIP